MKKYLTDIRTGPNGTVNGSTVREMGDSHGKPAFWENDGIQWWFNGGLVVV